MYNQYNDFVIYDDKFNVVLQNIGFFQANVNENSKVFSEPLELGSLVSDHQIFELVGIDCDCLASGETMLDDMNELDGFYKEHKKFIIQTKNKTYNNMIIHNRGEVQDSTSGLKFQLSFIEFLEEATEVKTVTATPKEPKDSKTVERGTVQGKEQPQEKRTSILGKI